MQYLVHLTRGISEIYENLKKCYFKMEFFSFRFFLIWKNFYVLIFQQFPDSDVFYPFPIIFKLDASEKIFRPQWGSNPGLVCWAKIALRHSDTFLEIAQIQRFFWGKSFISHRKVNNFYIYRAKDEKKKLIGILQLFKAKNSFKNRNF